MLEISPIRISTMTIYGHLGSKANLKTLISNCFFIPYFLREDGIIKISLNGETKGISSDDILHSSTKLKKSFLNQASLVFRFMIDEISCKEINIKIFANGGFQMTGINCEIMAQTALERFIEQNKKNGIWENTPFIQKFSICLINSDYFINKHIRRDRLHSIFIELYGLRSFFEPVIYQAVNTKYFWNKNRSADSPPGICGCPEQCIGDGDGLTIGACKVITIAPFRTGKIIINGARNREQIQEAYEFMNSIFRRFGSEVLIDIEETEEEKDKEKERVKSKIFSQTTELLHRKMRTTPKQVCRFVCAVENEKNIPALSTEE